MQRERLHNPLPMTWEIPLAITCLVALTVAVGVHLGNALDGLTAGRGWWWPRSAEVFTTIPGVLTGAEGPALAWILAVELLLLAALGGVGGAAWRRWGPSRLRGMATREQADRVLGVRRLKRVAPVVRPDLHPTGRTRIGVGR